MKGPAILFYLPPAKHRRNLIPHFIVQQLACAFHWMITSFKFERISWPYTIKNTVSIGVSSKDCRFNPYSRQGNHTWTAICNIRDKVLRKILPVSPGDEGTCIDQPEVPLIKFVIFRPFIVHSIKASISGSIPDISHFERAIGAWCPCIRVMEAIGISGRSR